MEKRVADLTLESQEQSATAERYKGEVARLETLLAEKELVLNQAQADLSVAQGEVVLTSVLPFSFFTELEKKVAEEASAADALKKSLDAEVVDCSALEAVVASVCEVLGVAVSGPGPSLQSRVEALYSQAGEMLREALHAGVKKALVVVSSHYIGIDLSAVSEGYVLPDDEAEASGDALASFFDAEVELPPLSAQGPRESGQ